MKSGGEHKERMLNPPNLVAASCAIRLSHAGPVCNGLPTAPVCA